MREYEFEQRPDVPERAEPRTRHKGSDLKNLRKEIGICRSCNALIWWGYRFGRPFPYDVGFEKDGTPYRRSPHKESCPYASDYQPSNRGNLRDRADAHTEAVRRWKAVVCVRYSTTPRRLDSGRHTRLFPKNTPSASP